MGGFWASAPRMGGITLFFALASLGLPGLGNFVGEFFILLGVYPAHRAMAAVAALGLVGAPVYALWMVQRTFYGAPGDDRRPGDLTGRESAILGLMALALLWLGLYPQPVFTTARPALATLMQASSAEPPLQGADAARLARARAAEVRGEPRAEH
jgi:NADH-quinone oxidoreductase subunit M